jgi:hypothetical protein
MVKTPPWLSPCWLPRTTEVAISFGSEEIMTIHGSGSSELIMPEIPAPVFHSGLFKQ